MVQMDAALAALPLDFERYEERAEILSAIHEYLEGTYTIFPEQKKETIREGNTNQLSIFDFMGAEVPEPEVPLPEGQEPEPSPQESEGREPDVSRLETVCCGIHRRNCKRKNGENWQVFRGIFPGAA